MAAPILRAITQVARRARRNIRCWACYFQFGAPLPGRVSNPPRLDKVGGAACQTTGSDTTRDDQLGERRHS